jgi:hypothetical protein
MAQSGTRGLAVTKGLTVVHKILDNGIASFSGSMEMTGSITPDNDGFRELGSDVLRWGDIHAVQTTVGAIFEYGLETEGIGKFKTGTVVCWHDGKLTPCQQENDSLVMGVVKEGKDQPIILGAEHVLVTGKVKEGDFLVTSNKFGHAKAAKLDDFRFGCVIGQALEDIDSESGLIKCMINKR